MQCVFYGRQSSERLEEDSNCTIKRERLIIVDMLSAQNRGLTSNHVTNALFGMDVP